MGLLRISVRTDTAEHLMSNYWSSCLVADNFKVSATWKCCRSASSTIVHVCSDCADINFLTLGIRVTFFHVHLSRDSGKDTVQSTGILWAEAWSYRFGMHGLNLLADFWWASFSELECLRVTKLHCLFLWIDELKKTQMLSSNGFSVGLS